jgi:prevent-host-death family protein
MAKVPVIVPVTDLRQDAAGLLRRMRRTGDPVFITQRGRAAAVLISVQEYERTIYEKGLLRALARGEKEIQQGKGFDLDSVLAEADEMLGEE